MWPRKITNPLYLKELYGNLPEVNPIEVMALNIEYDGPSAILIFATNNIPSRHPNRWGDYNSVTVEFRISPLESVSVRKMSSYGLSRLSFIDSNDVFVCRLTGAVEADMKAKYLTIVKVTGILDERLL